MAQPKLRNYKHSNIKIVVDNSMIKVYFCGEYLKRKRYNASNKESRLTELTQWMFDYIEQNPLSFIEL